MFLKIFVRENELIGLDFLKHYRDTFPHAVDFDKKMTKAFNATSWPNAVVIDKNGLVVAHEYVYKGGIKLLEEALEEIAEKEPYIAGSSISKAGAFCEGGICYALPGDEGRTSKIRQEFPGLAAAPDGSIYLTYTSNETGDNNIFLEKYHKGRLKKRHQITATPSDEYDAGIAVANDGTVWLAWTSNVDSTYDIYASSFKDGKLSNTMRVTRASNDAFHPRLAIDSEGNPWITYYRWIPEGDVTKDRNIYLKAYKNGQWSKELEISPVEPAVEDHSDPDIIPADNGMIVAWSYDYHPSLEGNTIDAASPSVFVQKVTTDLKKDGIFRLLGSKGKETRIKDISPAIATDGKIIACAWDAKKTIQVRRSEDGQWLHVEKVSQGESPCNAPDIAISPKGIFVCYSQLVDGRWRIVGRSFTDGLWQPQEFKDGGSGNNRFPAVACDKKGNAWVAYASESRDGVQVRLKRW